MNATRLNAMRRIAFLSILILAGLMFLIHVKSAQASPGILYVDSSSNCGNASPCYSTIQAAVDAAQPDDEIRVAAGMYPIRPGDDQIVHLSKSLTIRGGYATGNWESPDPDNNVTILNALGQGRVMVIDSPINVTLDGLRLAYGNATDLGSGGGIYAKNASLLIRHTWVMTNTAPSNKTGGGIYFLDGSLAIESSIIQANQAHSGGGLHIDSAEAVIKDSQILSNAANGGSSGWGGGGVLANGASQVSITGSIIRNNETGITTGGGGIMLRDVFDRDTGRLSLYLYDSLVEGNFAGSGGGINIYEWGADDLIISATIISNTIQENYSYYGGGGLSVSANVNILHNSILNNHGGTIKGQSGSNYGDGGGINASGIAWIEYNLIQNNQARGIGGNGRGGGAYLNGNGSIIFRYNTVAGNLARGVSGGRGGGIFIINDNVVVEANLIQGNSATGGNSYAGGGGVHIELGTPQLNNNIITGNSVGESVTRGSGLTIGGGKPTLIHNTIANNIGGAGQGIYVTTAEYPNADTVGQPVLYNTIIATQTIGIQVDANQPQNIATLYGILWSGNTANYGGTVFAFNQTPGEPGFVNPIGNDYHIGPDSDAIDKGVATNISNDLDNEPRFGLPDLGADEYWAPGALKRIYLPIVVK